MKPIKIRFSPKAEQDLREAWRHIAQHNIVAADELFDAVNEQVASLLDFPERGVLRTELSADLRMVVEGRYLIFYRIVEKEILVARVIHGSQDRTKIFT